jgi:glutathione synthase/RimK-type ligase-like ATP-grasp enzyme
MKEPILIASSSPDVDTYRPVSNILEGRGYPVLIYHGDKVVTGEEHLNLSISGDGELNIDYEGQSIAPQRISAAWYRKIGNISLLDPGPDEAKKLHINNEIRYLNNAVWALYPDEKWLNSPGRIFQAQEKLGQLLLARDLGFNIPETVISNDWDNISSRLLSDNRTMIVKMMHGVITESGHHKAMYTTPIDEAKLAEIRDYTIPFPGIYQSSIKKAREWRVTAVGDNVFPAAIYTDEEAKDDWRKHQLTDAVRFENEKLPEGIAEKCIQYLGRMGLKFGAFDFIEEPDGTIFFLECNPNGQYSWLEENLGFSISQAIAHELVAIACYL